MHRKFRPIVTDDKRIFRSSETDPTKEPLTTLVKPVAVPIGAKFTEAISSGYATSITESALFKPFPAVDAVKSSFDSHASHDIDGKDTFFSHYQNAGSETETLEPNKSTKPTAVTTVYQSLAMETVLDNPHNHPGQLMTKNFGDHFLQNLKTGRPESGNSQHILETRLVESPDLRKETQYASVSLTSGHLSENESAHRGILVYRDESREKKVSNDDYRPGLRTTPNPLSNGQSLRKHSPTSAGTAENPSKKTCANCRTSQELREKNKSISKETPGFSDGIESDDSVQRDPQEFYEQTSRIINSAPLRSHSLSRSESDDRKGVGLTPNIRNTPSGNKVFVRSFERKLSSATGSRDSDSNPWFQNNSSITEEGEDDEHSDTEDEKGKLGKGKNKKKSRLARLFRSGKSSETDSQGDSKSCSSGDSPSLRASVSNDSSVPVEDTNSTLDASEDYLEQTLRLAMSGKRNLRKVLDAILGLSGRPCEKTVKLLTKYLCSNIVIDAAFEIILEHEYAKKTNIPLRSMAPSHARYSPHREALVNLFTNGPERLKRALLNHSKARSEILRFFTEERPKGDVEIPHWVSTATNLSKILNALLAQFPAELSDYVGAKKGALYLMVKNHVHVPEVVEFVIQFCAANALSKTTGEDLRYGAANATGIVLLVKEGICDLLVDTFRRSSMSTAQGSANILEWQTQVLSTLCLLELSKRAVVIPRFTKENCSYSGRHIKALNSALDDLSLFTRDTRVLSLLNAGFDAISDGPMMENVQEQSVRNNPLGCALSTIIELLDTVRVAAGSKLAVTRRTLGSTNTEKVEKHLVSKMARLCKLLHRKSAHEASCRTRVAIVNLFRCLCASNVESTRRGMVRSQIPDRLMVLIRENQRSSVLHACVLKCISASFRSSHSIELHKEWVRALSRSDGWLQVMYEYFQKIKRGGDPKCKPFFSTFVEIGFCLIEFCETDKEAKLRPMLKTKTEWQTYVEIIEAGLLSIRKEYETPCGGPKPSERAVSVLASAETLAARLHDVNAV